MSEEGLRREADRWYRQSEDDLDAAEALLKAERYAQAAFWAQQAAEKAMKAVWISLDLEPWGHSVSRLMGELPEEPAESFRPFREAALHLDKLYIPTRYPDALAELIPGEAYTRKEAAAAQEHAAAIIAHVHGLLRRSPRGG